MPVGHGFVPYFRTIGGNQNVLVHGLLSLSLGWEDLRGRIHRVSSHKTHIELRSSDRAMGTKHAGYQRHSTGGKQDPMHC
jgi:hypothetical protein